MGRRGDSQMKMEAEIGVMQPQAKEHVGPPRDEGGKDDSPLEPLEGAWPCPLLDFGLLASRTVGEYISVVFSHPVCGALLQQPQGTHTHSILFFSVISLTTSYFHVVNLVIYLFSTSNSSASLVTVTFRSFPFPALSSVPSTVSDTQQMLNRRFLNE